MSSRTKSLRGRVTGQGSRSPAKTTIHRRISLVVGATSRASDRSPTGWFALSRKHGYVAIDRSNCAAPEQRRHCARSWLSHSLLYITLASQCRRERAAAFTGQPGPDVLDLQVIASLYVTLLTSAKRNARDHTCMQQQQPQSRAEAVGTLHRLTDLHAILLSHA
jgi:hypothetical protein